MRLKIFFKILHWAFKSYNIKIDVLPKDNEMNPMVETIVITISDNK